MKDAHCRHRTLAQGPAAQIQYCPECRAVAVHMGALTVRLQPAGAESLWATLGEALHELQRLREAEDATPAFARARSGPFGTA
ncbi:MAG TPA: hypothetical protein RMH99_01660 [Sandaracinaceae bacterium LLY-WYZ-13_1]|nr:hypothetical protein [Sandaracinaceae bacterium LLY-WYZ-13_1]